MTATLVETAPAKINLTLRVLGRRADGFHTLESLVAFAHAAGLSDRLSLQPGNKTALEVVGLFAGPSGPAAGNLVLKAHAALARRMAGLKAGHFHLEKNIPVAAGLGGGSADAAAGLRLLARLNGLSADDARLGEAALETGADVPVCLAGLPCIMRGVGEALSPPIALPRLSMVLVNPGVALATRDVFTKFGHRFDTRPDDAAVPLQADALLAYLSHHENDLTPAAISCAPIVAEVLAQLREAPGALLARMSGSGATCFALFTSAGEAAAAAWVVQARHEDWWVKVAALGSAPNP